VHIQALIVVLPFALLSACQRGTAPASTWLDAGSPPDQLPGFPVCDGGSAAKGEARLSLAIEALGPDRVRVTIRNVSCQDLDYRIREWPHGKWPSLLFTASPVEPNAGSSRVQCTIYNGGALAHGGYLSLTGSVQVQAISGIDKGCAGKTLYGWVNYRLAPGGNTWGRDLGKEYAWKYARSNPVRFPSKSSK